MASHRKLGRATDQRLAVLKNQVSYFLWYGKLETTYARAKEIQSLAEKYITLAINTYEDTVTVDKKKIVNGTETLVSVINDGQKKLKARRMLMSNLYDIHEVKREKETNSEFKMRIGSIKHPLIEKLFNEYAPKYAARAKELGQGGGYTAVYNLGLRRGDNAEVAVIQLI